MLDTVRESSHARLGLTSRVAGRPWPLIAGLLALWLAVVGIITAALVRNGGAFAYALDDAYIHMAMAKNLAQHGVWGITRYEFTSSSSSPLWTLLLAGLYAVAGAVDLGPLLLNVVCATGLVVVVARLLRREGAVPPFAALVLLGVVFVTPLPALAVTGQEHILHAWLVVVFAWLAALTLAAEAPTARQIGGLALLAALLTLTRYESLFLIAVAGGLALLRRRWRLTLLLGAAALVPLGLVGLVSVAHGWLWLPNSVVLKSNFAEVSGVQLIARILGTGYRQIREAPHILALTTVATALYGLRFGKQHGCWEPYNLMLTLFVGTALLHMQFAKIGWFFRYEAYLVTFGLLAVALPLAGWWPRRRADLQLRREWLPRYLAGALLVVLLALPLVERAKLGLPDPPQAMHERWLEHVTAAQFVARYYNDAIIVVNDIGAVAYLTDAHILDIFGLASMEPVAFRSGPGGYTKEDARDWARQRSAKIAILQTEWRHVAPRIPDEWVLVGEWELPSNIVFGDTTVGFFAVDPAEADQLAAHLRAFAPSVPRSITQRGRYME